MKNFLPLLFLLAFASFSVKNEKSCLSDEEWRLYRLINDYRESKSLPIIPISPALSHVAQLHAKDLQQNKPVNGRCNMHSWSNNGNWKPCCYTNDHKQAACMWNKPRELTQYKGDGFEIAAFLDKPATANESLDGWKSSPGHNDVIINRGNWKNMNWQAIGIGMFGEYAVVWFGIEPDSRTMCY